MSQALLTRREAAERARMCVHTLARHLRAPDGLTSVRLGGRVLIREADFDTWITRRISHPDAAA